MSAIVKVDPGTHKAMLVALGEGKYDLVRHSPAMTAALRASLCACDDGISDFAEVILAGEARGSLLADDRLPWVEGGIVPSVASAMRRCGAAAAMTPLGYRSRDWTEISPSPFDVPYATGIRSVRSLFQRLSEKAPASGPRVVTSNFAGGAGTISLPQGASPELYAALVVVFSGIPNLTPTSAPITWSLVFPVEGNTTPTRTTAGPLTMMPTDLMAGRAFTVYGYALQGAVATPIPVQNYATTGATIDLVVASGPANLQATLFALQVGSRPFTIQAAQAEMLARVLD
jgi:hypothetical protein